MYNHLLNFLKYLKNRFTTKTYISKAIQEIIIILAIVVVVKGSPPSALNIIILIFATLVVLRTTIIYSNALADKIDQKAHLRKQFFPLIYEEASNITKAVVLPIFILLLAYFKLITVKTALEITQLVLLITLFIYGYLGGKLSGDSVLKSLALGIFTLFIGSILVIVRSLI